MKFTSRALPARSSSRCFAKSNQRDAVNVQAANNVLKHTKDIMKRPLAVFVTAVIVTAASMFKVSVAGEANSKMLTLVSEVHKAVDADAERVQEIYKDDYTYGYC